MPSQWAFEDGALTELARFPDRGQLYGDALFETMLWSGRHLALKSYHITRLLRGCERLGIGLCSAEVEKYLKQFELSMADSFSGVALAVRLMCTPAAEGRGYGRTLPAGASLNTLITPLSPQDTTSLKLGVSTVQLGLQPLTAGLKHANRLEQVLGASELKQAGYEDGLMLDINDSVVCTTRANVYVLIDQVWHTPALDLAGVSGTRRAWLFDTAPKLSVSLCESNLTLASLERSSAIMVSNALRGFVSVTSVAGQAYEPHSAVDKINHAYSEYLDSER